MIKKKDEHESMCVMSCKLECGLRCICLYFAMFTIVERLCVPAVQIVCGEGESKAHKLLYWQLPLCSELLMYGPFPNG
jgi:hypothetical protein